MCKHASDFGKGEHSERTLVGDITRNEKFDYRQWQERLVGVGGRRFSYTLKFVVIFENRTEKQQLISYECKKHGEDLTRALYLTRSYAPLITYRSYRRGGGVAMIYLEEFFKEHQPQG